MKWSPLAILAWPARRGLALQREIPQAQSAEDPTSNGPHNCGNYNIGSYFFKKYRGVVQLVERRSPKPDVAGSSPVSPAKNFILEIIMDL